MKVLFVSSRSNDYVASCLWDGLGELLGENNVYDAVNAPSLHLGTDDNPCSRISASRKGRTLSDNDGPFDLMVINACFLREYEWGLVRVLRERLTKDARIAFIEGWDSATEVHEPPFPVDAIFRREIDPRRSYPYNRVGNKQPHSLMMAAPRRWFCHTDDRPFDVFYAANVETTPFRWDVLSKMWQTKTKHKSIGASCSITFSKYFDVLHTHKLAICPPGAGECGDCLRTWEVVAAGCIPIFVEDKRYTREPWFADDECFRVQHPDMLPYKIDEALSMDLKPMRDKMQAHVLAEHTTAARASRLLKLTGL
jgi:hypothetical protein